MLIFLNSQRREVQIISINRGTGVFLAGKGGKSKKKGTPNANFGNPDFLKRYLS